MIKIWQKEYKIKVPKYILVIPVHQKIQRPVANLNQ
jgi:hypothetical protein